MKLFTHVLAPSLSLFPCSVYDESTSTFVSFFDVQDAIAAAATLETIKSILLAVFKSPSQMSASLAEIEEAEWGEWSNVPVGEVINISGRSPFVTVAPGTRTLDVVSLFVRNPALHRVAVMAASTVEDPDLTPGGGVESLVGIVSQSDIVRWLASHVDSLPRALQCLEEQDVVNKSLVTVRDTDTVYEAFLAFGEAKVTGGPVVDSDGRLVGVLSASDVRRSDGYNLFSDLDRPVLDYLTLTNPAFTTTSHSSSLLPATGQVGTPMVELLRSAVDHSVHRLIIVDGDRRPRAVLSLHDLLTWFSGVSKLESVRAKEAK